MKLIVGLGNPGSEYQKTRHNAGFMAIDEIAKFFNVSLTKKFKQGLYCDFLYKGEKIILLKPEKYMNLSGDVIKDYLEYFKIGIDDLLVIFDDLDIEVGSFKIKMSGSSGGHNGLKSIENNIKTKDYKRIKIGISRNPVINTADYVLGKFSVEEMDKIVSVVSKMPGIIEDFLNISFERVMSKYN